MPEKIVVIDGRRFYDVPGMRPIPVEDLQDQGPPPSFMQKTGTALKNVAPEIIAGLSAVLAPETGGASLAIPPVAAGLTKALQNWSETGEIDPGGAMFRGVTNLIPGGLGKLAGKFLPGSGALARGLTAAGSGDSWISALSRGAGAFLESNAAPAVRIAAAGGKANAPTSAIVAQLEAKLLDPRLNATAKAAVLTALRRLQSTQTGHVTQGLRGVLGLTQGVLGAEDE